MYTSALIRDLSRVTPLKMAGILDEVKANRMGWLWGYDPARDVWYVKEDALDQIESLFYDHMAACGWPTPAKEWVLTMAIMGGAASLQWKDGTDVDVAVVVDWRRLFGELQGWPLARWQAVGLEDQYRRIQAGDRIQGTLVVKRVMDSLWGFGHYRGRGIIDRGDLNRVAPGHPINYRLVRSIHKDDLRFDDQPEVVEHPGISSYVVELPIQKRRDLGEVSIKDTVWIKKLPDLPPGFQLKRDVPQVYDDALGWLRHATMPFDYLVAPKTPKDITKALEVLAERYLKLKNARTEGYRAYDQDPSAYSFNLKGVTYVLPDAFPANVAYKLLESTGSKDAIIELLHKRRHLKDPRHLTSNFAGAKQELRLLLGGPYKQVMNLLQEYSKPVRYAA